MVQDLFQELEFRLGLAGDPESIEFTFPDDRAVDSAMGQWEAFAEQEFTSDDVNILLNVVDAIDILNLKYLRENFSFDEVDQDDVAGLMISYKRALGAVAYGVVGELYNLYSDRPGMFQAVFGRRLGRILYSQGKKDSDVLVRVEDWREQNAQSPGQFRGLIEDEINDQAKDHKKLATSLGMSAEVIDRVAKDFFLDRVKGTPVDLEAIAGEINQTGGEIVNWRIEQGKQVMKSALYLSSEELSRIEDDEKRHKLQRAIQAAKDKDRAMAGRRAFEQSEFNTTKHGKKDDSQIT